MSTDVQIFSGNLGGGLDVGNSFLIQPDQAQRCLYCSLGLSIKVLSQQFVG